jgi:transposase-like protein
MTILQTEMQAPTMTSGSNDKGGPDQAKPPTPPDPEVKKPKRRRFTAAYKVRILEEADACKTNDEIGSLLRREGLYSFHLAKWRKQRKEGALEGLKPKKRGRKRKPVDPSAKRVKELERENRMLKRKLERAELLLDIQKKASELLGIPLNDLENDESDS